MAGYRPRRKVSDLRVGGLAASLLHIPRKLFRVARRFLGREGERRTHDPKSAPSGYQPVADAQRNEALKSLLNFAVGTCLSAGLEWSLHAVAFGAEDKEGNRVRKLRTFATEQVLKRSGDVRAFLEIHKALRRLGYAGSERDRFHEAVARYLVDAMERREMLPAAAGEERLLALSLIILDDEQLRRFLDVCLPSLLAPGNLDALHANRRTLVLIAAPERLRATIERASLASVMRCGVHCRGFPDALANCAVEHGREMLTAALETEHLMDARRSGADIHFLAPQRVYPQGYFQSLLRVAERGHGAVLAPTLRANERALTQEAARHRPGDALAIGAAELVDLALDHLHCLDGDLLRSTDDDPSRLPQRRSFAWPVDGALRLHSADYSVAYLSRVATARLPDRLFTAPIRAVAAVQPMEPAPYLPTAADSLVHVDVVPERAAYPANPSVGLDEFKSYYWEQLGDWQGQLFQTPCEIPRGTGAQPCFARADVDAAVRGLSDVLGSFLSFLGPNHIGTLLHVLKLYETSSYGRSDMPRIRREAEQALGRLAGDPCAMPADIRRHLIRCALNFDLFDLALDLAGSGGAETEFTAEFLAYIRRQIERNRIQPDDLQAAVKTGRVSVIGSVVWGGAYVRNYLDYHLASLLAPGNIPALAARGTVVLSIVTTQRGREQIEAHPIWPLVSRHAKAQFTIFPEAYLRRRESAQYNFYYFYGLLDHLHVYFARDLGADLYLLPVDCVYSGRALANLERHIDDGADCCSIAGIETDQAGFLGAIEAEHKGASILDIDGATLLETASKHAGRYFRSLIMSEENARFSRHPRELIWPIEGGFMTHSIFMHPLAVSSRVLRRPFWPDHENVDYALIPRLLQGDGRMDIVTDARDVAIAHFSPPQVRDDYVSHGFSLRRFVEVHDHDYSVHREFFAVPQFFPCSRSGYSESTSYRDELAAIAAALRQPAYGHGPERG